MTAVKLVYEGRREAAAAEVFYEAVGKSFLGRFRSHGLVVYGRSRSSADEPWGQATLHFQQGLNEELLPSFCEYYHLRNVWAANEPGAAVTSSMLYPDDRLKRTEYWADWLRHNDIF